MRSPPHTQPGKRQGSAAPRHPGVRGGGGCGVASAWGQGGTQGARTRSLVAGAPCALPVGTEDRWRGGAALHPRALIGPLLASDPPAWGLGDLGFFFPFCLNFVAFRFPPWLSLSSHWVFWDCNVCIEGIIWVLRDFLERFGGDPWRESGVRWRCIEGYLSG